MVGTLLTLANQGTVWLAGEPTVAVLLRALLNYLVPFAVAVHSRSALLRELSHAAFEREVEVEGTGR